MKLGGIDVMLNDQLTEDQINQAVRDKASALILAAPFNASFAFLGKAKEGVGGFRLVIMSATMQKDAHTIEVKGMKPWD